MIPFGSKGTSLSGRRSANKASISQSQEELVGSLGWRSVTTVPIGRQGDIPSTASQWHRRRQSSMVRGQMSTYVNLPQARIQGVGAEAGAHPWDGASPFKMNTSIAFKQHSATGHPPLGEILYPPLYLPPVKN